jgi:cysteine desulfurase
MKPIYFDNAATTSLDPDVFRGMTPYFTKHFGNASSMYGIGRDAHHAIDLSRKRVAAAIGAEPSEIYFTCSGTESDNWALKGAAYANSNKGKHIISSNIEHHAVLHTLSWLEKQGFYISRLPVDELGYMDPALINNAITEHTVLITVMAANNEIGTIEPIRSIGEIARNHRILFHTDAVQAIGAIPVNVHEWGVDMLSLSAHKFHGPKGVGALYIKKGIAIDPLLHGGAQERGKRASTENLPGIVGMGLAIEKAVNHLDVNVKKMISMRDKLIDGILSIIPESRLNGSRTERLPGNVNISIRYIEGEALLLRLDLAGIAASSGSACTSGSLDPSHVLLAIGLPHEIAHGSLRLSLNADNTMEEVNELLQVLPAMVKSLRNMSPLYSTDQSEQKG